MQAGSRGPKDVPLVGFPHRKPVSPVNSTRKLRLQEERYRFVAGSPCPAPFPQHHQAFQSQTVHG